jgi:hypothetical protein
LRDESAFIGRAIRDRRSVVFAIGDERIEFTGISSTLEIADDNWPYKRKTDYLFRKITAISWRYYLGPQKRPVHVSICGRSAEEYFEDVLDEKIAYFGGRCVRRHGRRKILFSRSGKEIARHDVKTDNARQGDDADRTSFTADRLHITIVGSQQGIVRDGDPKELLIPLELPPGKSKLVLEYRW